MYLLRRLLEYLMGKRKRPETSRVFLQDAELIAVIKDVAKQQSRAEEEVMAQAAERVRDVHGMSEIEEPTANHIRSQIQDAA